MRTVINLADLADHPEVGFVIQGANENDQAGTSVAVAGDVNGDGIPDLIVGAFGSSDGGAYSGDAYVLFGKADGYGTIDLAGLAQRPEDGFVIQGAQPGDWTGLSVSGAGDINGDGYADVIVGASDYPGHRAGSAAVIFGHAGGFGSIDLAHLDPADGFLIDGSGKMGNHAGFSVSSAGDLNGDGFADIILSAEHHADYVLYGKSGGFGTVDLAGLAARPEDGFVIGGNGSGYNVASAGDINHDGFDDIIVSAGYSRVCVIFGRADGYGTLDVNHLGSAGFTIHGIDDDELGASISGAGDINGDGFNDIIVGAPTTTINDHQEGDAYVIFGKAGGFSSIDVYHLAPADGFKIKGAFEPGSSVAGAGDVNGDGFADVLVGAPNEAEQEPGSAYVIFGKAGGFGTIDLNHLSSADGFIIQGAAIGDEVGRSVSAAGDLNGDGFDDIIVGAPTSGSGGQYSGTAYVIYGQAPTESVTRTGSAIGQTIHGGSANDVLNGLEGADTLIGGGGDDTLVGGSGDDILIGGQRKDSLTGGGGADIFRFAPGDGGAVLKYADLITDFHQAEHDRIDLSQIDADRMTAGQQSFHFIGAGDFGGVAGELRYAISSNETIVQGDTDGDGIANFTIELTGQVALTSSDFVLTSGADAGADIRHLAPMLQHFSSPGVHELHVLVQIA